MDVIQFLKGEHHKARAAVSKVIRAESSERGHLWDELEPELAVHEQIEDECLYAPLSADAGGKDPKLAGWRDEHEQEVEEVETLIEELGGIEAEEERWLDLVKAVQSKLENHIREEEGEIFPRIAKVWDKGRREEAGKRMNEMKAQKLGPVS